MEERASPATDSKRALNKTSPAAPPPPPSSPPPPPPPLPPVSGHGGHHNTQQAFRSGTYVVQVPKDQIYRVPTQEHAAYYERHQRSTTKPKRSMFSCVCFPIFILFLLLLGFLVIVGLSYLILKPKELTFSVQNITVTSHSPEYHLTLIAVNPNERIGAHCMKGGHASLSFKNHKFSTGTPPSFSIDAKSSKQVRLLFSKTTGNLPSELHKSKKGIELSLLIKIPMKMEILFLSTWTMNMAITCDLMVNTLAKSTRLSSQKCNTKIQIV